jgi:hypothetical protein
MIPIPAGVFAAAPKPSIARKMVIEVRLGAKAVPMLLNK